MEFLHAKSNMRMRNLHVKGVIITIANNTNPWTKSNKISTHQQITKKIGAIFGGEFSDLGRKQQNQARKHGVGAPKM